MSKNGTIALNKVVWDPEIYPRSKWSTETIDRYADAMEAGDKFPRLIVEAETNRLLDGKHRYEAYKKVGIKTAPVEFHEIPEGMSAKYYAATLSSRHGDRMSNADLKALAEEEFELDSSLDPTKWGKRLGVSRRSVYRWVSHILQRERATRAVKAWHLAQLGWTNIEIAERLKVVESSIREDRKKCQLAQIANQLGADWNEKGMAELAERAGLPLTDCWAAAMDGLKDEERMERLSINVQPYDVWNFSSCHDLMGASHPGRIPGELVCHVMYFYTKPGDLVIDPMAGSGTTLDACLLMGRKGRGYDIDLRHERIDIEEADLMESWPETIGKASLIFWDPPYFNKKDKEYVEGSISGLERKDYLQFFADCFSELKKMVKKGTVLAFLMSDWNDNENKEPGVFLWDYVNLLLQNKWTVERQIQCPLTTQGVHPDIVKKFRKSRKLARLNRSLVIARS